MANGDPVLIARQEGFQLALSLEEGVDLGRQLVAVGEPVLRRVAHDRARRRAADAI